MNRSYSKIRHIQELNKKLENRLLLAESSDLEIASDMISDAGVDIDPNEIVDADVETCVQPETGDPQKDGILNKVWDWAHAPETSISDLKSIFNQVKTAIRDAKTKTKGQSMTEQVAAPLIIAGVTINPLILVGIGALILIIIISAIIKKNSRSFKGCRRRRRLIKKHGFKGNFM
jgi:hypothetical protein